MRAEARKRLLLLGAGGQGVGIPLESVREIMRPLPIISVGGAPAFVLGLSIIRGSSVPVVDLGALLGVPAAGEVFGRFATLEVDGRTVALAVQRIDGIADVDGDTFVEMPPLLSGAAGDSVESLALHDEALLLVLRASKLWPAGLELTAGAPA